MLDTDLWAAVVAAEQQAASARAEFYHNAESRHDVLAAGLHGSRWEQRSALTFLECFPDDVPALLDQVIDLATSPRWAGPARQAIASNKAEAVVHRVRQLIDMRLENADADDYRRLAELLVHLNDTQALRALIERAKSNNDPEIREVGEDFSF